MPIEIKSSTSEIQNLLTNSINRLLLSIDDNLITNVPIVITDLDHVPVLFPSSGTINEHALYSRILNSGYGITQPKHFSITERKHLLVVNVNNIKSSNLTDIELDAVLAHELGHIFNVPPKEIEDFGNQTEYFADYFAKSLNLRGPLLSSIEKYLKQDFAKNANLFQMRIEKLNKNEIFNGSINVL